MNLDINCDYINSISPTNSGEVEIELVRVNTSFIQELDIEDIVSYADNEKLIEAIIKNDPCIINKYID